MTTTASEIIAGTKEHILFGMRVIESPLTRMPRKRKKLKHAWTQDSLGDHYTIVEVVDGYEDVAFLFNAHDVFKITNFTEIP